MIERVLRTQYFYFSYTYDLTHSLQQLNNTNPEFLFNSIYERVSSRFKLKIYKLNKVHYISFIDRLMLNMFGIIF